MSPVPFWSPPETLHYLWRESIEASRTINSACAASSTYVVVSPFGFSGVLGEPKSDRRLPPHPLAKSPTVFLEAAGDPAAAASRLALANDLHVTPTPKRDT